MFVNIIYYSKKCFFALYYYYYYYTFLGSCGCRASTVVMG